jgi:hypothetical protein
MQALAKANLLMQEALAKQGKTLEDIQAAAEDKASSELAQILSAQHSPASLQPL